MKLALAQFKWILWLLVAVGVAVLFWVFRGLFVSPHDPSVPSKPIDPSNPWTHALPPIPPAVQQMVTAAHDHALEVKAETKATTAEKLSQLDVTKKITDENERRKALVNFIESV